MNERIKQLAEQAGFMMWGDEAWNPGDVIDWAARYDDELEKFAELIVRECCLLTEEYQHRVTFYRADETIKKHFWSGTMNRLEIFQKVYGTDHVFTAQELERLGQVAELIVRECIEVSQVGSITADKLKQHFGVKE